MRTTTSERAEISTALARGSGVLLAVAAYAYTLHWIYSNLITETFAYLGYGYSSPGFYAVMFTYLAGVAVALLLPRSLERPSDVMLWILYMVAIAPSIFVPSYAGYQSGDQAIISGVGIAAAYAVSIFACRRPRAAQVQPILAPLSTTSFWLFIGIYSVFAYAVIGLTLGLSLEFVALLEVYDQRDEYREGLAGGNALVGYLVSTQANVVNPLIIARGIQARQWHLVVLGALGQAVLYSGTGFKTVLFSVPAILVFTLLLRKGRSVKTTWLLWGGVAVAGLAAIADELQGDIIWTSLFSRRFLITPGVLTAVYMKFYSENPQAQLSYSVLKGVTEDHYNFPPARTIGYFMTGNHESAANANLFADGFANFGPLGFLGAAVVLGLYLRFLDRAAAGIPLQVSALVVIMPAVALSNTSILTALLSHGLVAALLLLALSPRDTWLGTENRLEGESPAVQAPRGIGTAPSATPARA